jgi:FtsH-binding integral membrane protein
MFLGLGITAVTATVVAGSPSIVNALVANRMMFLGLIAAQLGLVFYLWKTILPTHLKPVPLAARPPVAS